MCNLGAMGPFRSHSQGTQVVPGWVGRQMTKPLADQGFLRSGRPDSNRGPPAPKAEIQRQPAPVSASLCGFSQFIADQRQPALVGAGTTFVTAADFDNSALTVGHQR
jgi:hypothetical protein